MAICEIAKTEGWCVQIKVCSGSGDAGWNTLPVSCGLAIKRGRTVSFWQLLFNVISQTEEMAVFFHFLLSFF